MSYGGDPSGEGNGINDNEYLAVRTGGGGWRVISARRRRACRFSAREGSPRSRRRISCSRRGSGSGRGDGSDARAGCGDGRPGVLPERVRARNGRVDFAEQ